MAKRQGRSAPGGFTARLGAFVTERYPFALGHALSTSEAVVRHDPGRDAEAVDLLRLRFVEALRVRLADRTAAGLPEPTPGIAADERLETARADLVEACDGWFRREAIAASLRPEERREILRGMVLTRAVSFWQPEKFRLTIAGSGTTLDANEG